MTLSMTNPNVWRVAVVGTGNMGRAALRAVADDPRLALAAIVVSDPAKVGLTGPELCAMDRSKPPTPDAETDAVRAVGDLATLLESIRGGEVDAVAYMASGDFRPDEALNDVLSLVSAGARVVTPALYPLYDPNSAPPELSERVHDAIAQNGGSLLVSGIDPGWANDWLPVVMASFSHRVTEIRCQELFDYSTYDAEDAVRGLVGMGGPVDSPPPMILPGIPTMVWGGQLRLLARALGLEIDDIVERSEQRALDTTVNTALGDFLAGTQGGLRFEVVAKVGDAEPLVVEHITRIHPDVAPDWPSPPAGDAGAHRVVVSGEPSLTITVQATAENGNHAAGGNATAAVRLLNGAHWLCSQAPGWYSSLDVPVEPVQGRVVIAEDPPSQ